MFLLLKKFSYQNKKNENIQFFLIANGQSYNKNLQDLQHPKGTFKFVVDLGGDDERLAKITDDPSTIDLIYQVKDKVTQVEGNIYHTADAALNHDSKSHSISGLLDDNDNTLRISFEDFPNLGDRDFNDVIFDVNISYGHELSDHVKNLNEISPAGGDKDITDGDLYDDVDDLLDQLFGLNSLDGNSFFEGFNEDVSLGRGTDTNEVVSEYVDTLIELGQQLEDHSSLNEYIANYLEETAVGGSIESEVATVEGKSIDVSHDTSFDFIANEHVDYLI